MPTREVRSASDPELVRGPTCHPEIGITGLGYPSEGVVIVGIAPGNQEVRAGQPFVGQSGKLLNAILDGVGFPRSNVYCTNLVCWYNNNPTEAQIAQCQERFDAEMELVKPRLIVALGKIPTEHLTGHKFADASGQVLWSTKYDCWIMGTNHPAAVLHSGGNQQDAISNLVRDLKKIDEVRDWARDYGTVEWGTITDASLAERIIGHWYGQALPIALDVETVWGSYNVRCLAVSAGGVAYTIPREVANYVDWNQWADGQWVYHNAQFDVRAMQESFDVTLAVYGDTMLMSYALDERGGGNHDERAGFRKDKRFGLHSLKKLSREYCGADFYEIDTQTDDLPLLYEYNAKDAAYTARLWHRFDEMLKADDVWDMYHTYLLPGVMPMLNSKKRGVHIDLRRKADLGLMFSSRMLHKYDELQTLAQDAGRQGELNPSSHLQVKEVLYDYLGLPYTELGRSSAKGALDELADLSPFIQTLLEYRKCEKMLSTYVDWPPEWIDSKGYIHPDALLHGTVSGRLVYTKPPVGTIPKHGEEGRMLRSMFNVEDDTREIIQADYSQSELWAAYTYSGDENLLADLKSGDFHGRACENMFRIVKADYISEFGEDAFEDLRDKGKTVTFGIMFGRQAKAVGKAIGRSRQEAQDLIDAWFDRYRDHARWYEVQRKETVKTGESVAKSGRKRRWHLVVDFSALNQAVNWPIQTSSHDNLVLSYYELAPLLLEFDAHIAFEVHDSLIVDAPKAYRNEVVSLMKRVMEKDRIGISIPVELKAGPNWGELVKV